MEVLGMTRYTEGMAIEFDYQTGSKDLDMQKKIIEFHEKAMEKLKEKRPELFEKDNFKRSVRIVLNHRMRSCAGKARSGNVVEINYRLHKDNPQELEDTYVHELAHIVCQRCYPRERGHGYTWQNVMSNMGLVPTRTHNLDVSKYKAKRKKYIYACSCRNDIELSSVRHGKINKGASYTCTRCRTSLVFTGV